MVFQRFIYWIYRSFTGTWYQFCRRFSPAGRYLWLALMLFALFGVDATLTVAYQAFSILAALIACALISVVFRSRSNRSLLRSTRISVERFMPHLVTVGVPFKYTLQLHHPSSRFLHDSLLCEKIADPRPTFERFQTYRAPEESRQNWIDRKFMFLRWVRLVEQKDNIQLPEAPIHIQGTEQTSRVEIQALPLRRGSLHLEGVYLERPEPLGLARNLHFLPHSQVVTVLPKRYPVPRLEFPGTQRHQEGGVVMASSVGESEEFVSLRDYRPGDPLRKIHWRSWARRGVPVVREYQDEFFVRHAILLDTWLGQSNEQVFEESVSIAASYACTLQNQDTLLDLLFAGDQAYCFSAGRGLSQSEHLLEILSGVHPSATLPYDALRTLSSHYLPQASGCLCILNAWDAPRRKLVEHLIRLQTPLKLFLVTPDKTIPPRNDEILERLDGAWRHIRAGHVMEDLS